MDGKNGITCLCAIALLLLSAGLQPAFAGKKRKKTPPPQQTAYEKLFDGKQVKTARGLFTLHKIEGEIYLEFPDSLIGRPMLLGATVMSVSDGEESSEGMQPSAPRQVVFLRTDSLLQIAAVGDIPMVGEEDDNIRRAVEAGRQPSVLASFPISALAPDGRSAVARATKFFLSDSRFFSPKDPESYSSREGFVTRTYKFKPEASCIRDVASFRDNASVVSELSYDVSAYVFGVIARGESQPFTAMVRIGFMLLPERMQSMREADARVGTAASRHIEYSSAKQGAAVRYLASRWRVGAENPIVFYLDDKLPEAWKPHIERGVLLWNDAFRRIGIDSAIRVRRVAADSMPDINDIHYSAIRYIPSPARNIRHNMWTDSRTGEILSANIYVSHNIVQQIQTERLLQTGAADPRARKILLDGALFGESLTQKIAHYTGLCLGLLPNKGASETVPVDSLRSGHYTRVHGLSASVMDELPLNYVARAEDFESGTILCQTALGAYDYYAIGWLYGDEPVRFEPEYRFLRAQSDKFSLDPRAVANDLGDDPLRAADYVLENLAFVMRHAAEWVDGEDPDYAYRKSFPEYVSFYYNSLVTPVIAQLGGVYIRERYAGDRDEYYRSVPAAVQRRAMEWLLRSLDDMEWLNRKELIVGEGLNPGIADFIRLETFDRILGSLDRIALSAALSDDPYTRVDALNDLSAYLWNTHDAAAEAVKQPLQIRFVDRLLSLAKQGGGDSDRKSDYFPQAAAGSETSAIAPLTRVSYLTWPEDKHLIYGVMEDCRRAISAARAKSASPAVKAHYGLLLHRIGAFFADES